MVLHAYFAWHQPFTNDEGAYLYDARTIGEGSLPAGDVLTKAPVPIALFAAGELLTGNSLFAARIVNVIASILSVIPLFFLLRILSSSKAAYVGLALWLLGSGTIVFHTLGHTQAIANLFVLTCLSFFVRGIMDTKVSVKYVFLAGVSFVLAYASRKSAIAVIVPVILSWIVLRDSIDGWSRVVRIFLMGIATVCIPWIVGLYVIYDLQGVWHLLGGSYADILVHSSSITPWAGDADHMFSEAMRIGSLYGLLLIAVCIAGMRERVLIGASWIATLGVLYSIWPTHLVEYLADFIPSIVVASSVAITSFRLGMWQRYILYSVFLGSSIISLHSVYIQPWTGMFTRDAVTESAEWITEHVPMHDDIFTAAVIIPYVSGHHVPFNLSHPQWYRYDFISQKDKDLFLPHYDEVKREVQVHTMWALYEQLTEYAYPSVMMNSFQEMYVVPNDTLYRQNPLAIYYRRSS